MIYILRHQFSLMVLYAIGLHYLWAACVLIDRGAVYATALSVFYSILAMPHWMIPATLVFVASAAIMALCIPMGRLAIGLMLPQQFTLMISAWGALEAAISGHFGDGVERSHFFILADQSPAILAAIGHTMAIIGMGQRWKLSRSR